MILDHGWSWFIMIEKGKGEDQLPGPGRQRGGSTQDHLLSATALFTSRLIHHLRMVVSTMASTCHHIHHPGNIFGQLGIADFIRIHNYTPNSVSNEPGISKMEAVLQYHLIYLGGPAWYNLQTLDEFRQDYP